MTYSQELIERLYKSMKLIRRVEERIAEVYFTDVIKSPVHLSIGQESVAVGLCDALKPEDMISNTYRCHATYLAKGGDLNQMMAELYGKKDGCAHGKAGSMHLIDMKHGVMGASAVVGTTVPVAAGYALAQKQNKTGNIVATMFGDGATDEGCYTETLNFAALQKLPLIFLLENNRLAIHSKLEQRWPTNQMLERVKTFGIKTWYIDDADVLKLRDAALEAAEYTRSGKGPAFIQCDTYRWLEHVGPTDDHKEDYRDEAEFAKWKANDQIDKLGDMLGDEVRTSIDKDIEADIKAAEEFATNSPFPGIEELYEYAIAS